MSLEEITLGVGNFSDENYIIRGYGKLYRGEVQHNSEHKMVVVRRFSRLGQEHGFLREFEVLFKHKQENIIGLVGYCKELDEKIIVYEDASNGCLSRYLNDTSFSWSTRLKICIDIANGLHFLHGGSVGQDVVIHRDIKSSNILLTEDWKAKIWGFEHALTYPANKEIKYLKNDVVGSPGYCDPLYWETHTLTKESDIYSFGVVLFEILCGRMACPQDFTDSSLFLDVLVKRHFQVARVEEIVFEGIKEQVVLESLATFRRIAFQCLHEKREERPTAGEVVAHLQKALEFQESYEIWEAKLPRNYKEILQFSKSPEIYTTMVKKDIHDILSKGILLKDDKLWFSIADSGERSEMVASRMFSFRNRWSHRWRSIQESRFPKVAEMLDITNLNILIKIRPQFLPSDVNYSVHLVFKFCCPRKSNAQRMYVNLKYKIGKENSHAYFAMWREDNWMTIELCRYSNLKKDTSFEILLQEFSRCYCDSRAIYIEGIEFRVIDNASLNLHF
ncbi:putative serine/threonine-protein kinase PBL28 [Bidens hawaiensis]|uniref:putative serine/threonine-protein kinase PBL28 n=1 Tax=Bidens hawaiensis TaxID=980011 RepID=UPI0040495068